ncbi:MAG: choice-of-anchor tandem repeat GloVer-containing protein [Bryobacteraceae bacterium]|jgi:uncharacterized repeat protein (TIGR03803 family)
MANCCTATVCSIALLIAVPIVIANSVVQAATLTTIHSFAGYPSDGSGPAGGLVIGPGGVLYGATYSGGADNCGTVFSLTPPASGDAWTPSVYSFPTGPDGWCLGGANPVAGLAIARGGAVLYGSTQSGGSCSGGTIFELRPPAAPAGSWAESVVLNVCAFPSLAGPNSSPVVGRDGVLYATILGDPSGASEIGRVFSLTPPASPGRSWSETVLHTFTGPGDGTQPNGVALGSDGQLYGTTESGGTGPCYGGFSGCGTVYSLTPPKIPGDTWVEAILHNFTDRIGDGTFPVGAVLVGSDGVLYGVASAGALGAVYNDCSEGCGSVYSLIPPGSSGEGKFSVLYQFTGVSNGDGAVPSGGLTALHGVLYGSTASGGLPGCFDEQGCGTIFSLTPPASVGGSWTETVLYRFPNAAPPASPNGSLVADSNGILYGVTWAGGAFNQGTVFSFTP